MCWFFVTTNIELVGVLNDALHFQVGLTKTDQEGSKHIDHPFHVFSCPENPVICPVLALSKHLLCNPRILCGKCKLFEGSNQYERFNSILHSIVQSDEYCNEFINFGVHPKYFRTHSMRKGAASHVACGITSCPPVASICFRANRRMPGVMNRYIKYKGAGDQYVGRCVSGRNRLGKGFAESLPYFDFSHRDSVQKGLKRREVDQ